MKKLFICIDRKSKTDAIISEQIAAAKEAAEKEVGSKTELVDSAENADFAWFVDEWEDDVACFQTHEYCLNNGIRILHDKSEFWNRVLT